MINPFVMPSMHGLPTLQRLLHFMDIFVPGIHPLSPTCHHYSLCCEQVIESCWVEVVDVHADVRSDANKY